MTLTEWIFRSLAVLFILLAALAIAWGFIADRVRGRTKHPRCPKCWYDLSGVVEHETSKWRCSECGFVATGVTQLHTSRKRWWTIVPAALFSVMSVLAWAWPTIDRDGWRAAVPTWTIIHFWPIDEVAWAEGAGGGDMAYELDRRIDTNVVSAELLDAWAKRVETAYNRSRAMKRSTLSGAPLLVNIDVPEVLWRMSATDARVDVGLGEGTDDMGEKWLAKEEKAGRTHTHFTRMPAPPHFWLLRGRERVQGSIVGLVAPSSWTINGGLDGTIRPCGTNLLIINSPEACENAKQLIAAITAVSQRVSKGETGVTFAAFDEGDHRVVVRDVGDIPLIAARVDAWADERAEELRGRLVEAIDPDSWTDNGGEVGTIMTFDRLLIIRHTPAVQARIDEQLKQWRAEAAGAATK